MRLLVLAALLSARAWACSCAWIPSAKEAWLAAPAVFAGVVEHVELKTDGERDGPVEMVTRVRVTEPVKGVKKDEILELRNYVSSCSWEFHEGMNLLFYLHQGETRGSWITRACGRTRSLRNAADDLRFLRGLPGSARGSRVSGTVSFWDEEPGGDGPEPNPMAGVRVRAEGAPGRYETTTDAEGVYEFRDLPPGAYQIQVDYPKGTTLNSRIPVGSAGQRRGERLRGDTGGKLEVTAESGNGVDFYLSPDTRVSGRVLDPEGRPMEGVCVELEGLQENAQRRFYFSSCTKPDGSYVISKVPAGRYRAVANRDGAMTAREPIGRLYYPGTAEREKAGVLTVAAGQHVEGINILVPELARRIELRGRLTFNDGVAHAEALLAFRGHDGRYSESVLTDGEGKFVMRVLAGRPGTLTGEIAIWRERAGACPQVPAKFSQEGLAAQLESTPYPVAGDVSLSEIQVVFPFPSCKALLRRVAGKREE